VEHLCVTSGSKKWHGRLNLVAVIITGIKNYKENELVAIIIGINEFPLE